MDCYLFFSLALVLLVIDLSVRQSYQVEIRLRDGQTPFEGRVEIRRDGENSWRYMCGTGAAGWNQTVARAVCKHLGYFTVMWEWPNSEFGRSNLQSSVCDVRCNPLSESLEDCTINWDNNRHDCQCNDIYHVGITCYYPGFLGRYKESYDRIFRRTTSWPIPQSDVTVQGCIGACRNRGKTIAVLASADECYCSDDSVDYWRYGEAIPGLPILNDTQAVKYNTQQCSGDTGTSPYMQGCGGNWQSDVYNTSFGVCGCEYIDSSGYIYSPNFPGKYTNEQSCNWTITVDPGHIVKLTTLMLRLQDNDMVIVKDGIEDNSSTISTFTGYSLPQPLYSSSNTIRIEMITDDAGNDLGFVLQYKAISPVVSSTARTSPQLSTATSKSSVGSTVNENTPTQKTLTSTPTRLVTSPELKENITMTSRMKNVSTLSASTSPEGIQPQGNTSDDMYMYIGIGGGMFIFLALVLIVVIVVLLRRKQRTKKQKSEEHKLTSIPDLIRKGGSPDSDIPDVTPEARESDANTAFINESYRPQSFMQSGESISGDGRHRIDETQTEGLSADYDLLGPASDKGPVCPHSIGKTPSKLDDSYAQVVIHKEGSNGNSTCDRDNEEESQAGPTCRQSTYDNMQTEDAPADDWESEDALAAPERGQLRLEESKDVEQMYAQVDKSKKKGRTNETGYVDNVLYESMSDTNPSKREGFVDNIVYESASNMV
ncbi:uncharacterized protein [Ptychodera flava]|uniref:uncharacterized protein n=1 Tax=Ptychodera flava TaxID=63121 RepID=UPI00396A941E